MHRQSSRREGGLTGIGIIRYDVPLALTEDEIDDLVAFLASLTSSPYHDQGIEELARQRALSRTTRPQRDTARAFAAKPVRPKPPEL